ncbi:MAG: AbrB/MazE/SpoVT family DNA-binding domain-containing protein [Gaiellaceae bacterium]
MVKLIKPKRRRGFTRLSGKRQVTIPLQALEQTGLGPGDELKVEVDPAGRIVLTPTSAVPDRRQVIEQTSGSLAGVYEKRSLEDLRDEWR